MPTFHTLLKLAQELLNFKVHSDSKDLFDLAAFLPSSLVLSEARVILLFIRMQQDGKIL